jgi:hypothetical protein
MKEIENRKLEKELEQKKGKKRKQTEPADPAQPARPSSHPNRFLSPFLFLFFSFHH